MFYDGRMKMERCAVVLRIAPTWFRWARLPCGIDSKFSHFHVFFVIVDRLPCGIDTKTCPSGKRSKMIFNQVWQL